MYEIILLDYSMPEMDGPTIARKIRNICKNSVVLKERDKEPYICCSSAYEEAAFKGKALSAGMDHFLMKPISSQELDKLLLHLS